MDPANDDVFSHLIEEALKYPRSNVVLNKWLDAKLAAWDAKWEARLHILQEKVNGDKKLEEYLMAQNQQLIAQNEKLLEQLNAKNEQLIELLRTRL